MDCGPAALAALLSAHGIEANVDALRTVCATDVDGTSVDDLEEVAADLGLEAEQIVVPLEQVLACPEAHLPALVLTLTPDGYIHFVTAWRVRRRHVDLVDPAIGHRAVRRADFAREVLTHELVVGEEEWAEYALGHEAAAALTARLRAGGSSADAATERYEAALAGGPVSGIGGLLDELAPQAAPVVERVGDVLDGQPQVRVRAAVLVRAPRKALSANPPPKLAAVLAAPTTTPMRELRVLLRQELRVVNTALALSVLAGLSGVAELLAAERTLNSGATPGRLLGLLVAVAASLLLGAAARSQALAAGRRIEHQLRDRLFDRVTRLGDAYVRSRPTGDLAERGHATVHVRTAIELVAWLVRMLTLGIASLVAMVVVAPVTWPVALCLLSLLLVAPPRLASRLREPDFRARTMHGAISLQLTDTLGAGAAVQSNREVLRELHAPLLRLRSVAAATVQRRLAVSVGTVEVLGLVGAGAAVAVAAAGDTPPGVALVSGALAFTAATAAQDVALIVRRGAAVRSALGRLLEPLTVRLDDPPPCESPPGSRPDGVRIEMRDVTVRLGARDVLREVDLTIAAGEHVAVVGRSGAGKSSLASVLAGWLVPTSGTIHADGEPLTGSTLARLRRSTSWADATTQLWDDTLEANADYGRSSRSSTAMTRLSRVGLDSLVQRLAHRTVGSDGRRLGSGEAQRLRLARALGRPDARLVLLDEALSELPSADQRALLTNRRESWPRATIVAITHNVDAALDFDRVLVIDGGRLVEDGHPHALAVDPQSALRRMLAMQWSLGTRLAEHPRRTAEPTTPRAHASRQPEPSPPEPARSEKAMRSLVANREVTGSVALALLVSLAATLLLVTAAGRLQTGARSEPIDWVEPALVLLAVAGLLTGVAAAALGRASVAFGDWIRRRALGAGTSGDDRSVGQRVGLVLDLEHAESAALGAGATLAFAVVESLVALGALLMLGHLAGAAAMLLGLGAMTAGALRLARVSSAATEARSAATAHLVDRMLALRTVTLQEDPAQERTTRTAVLDAIARTQRRVDSARTAVSVVLPRAIVLGILATLAANPPAGAAEAAAALGATLLALSALDRVGMAAADVAPASSSARAAWSLLDAASTSGVNPTEVVVPPPDANQVLHQPLAANALLATRAWPPDDATMTALGDRLSSVGLGDLIDAMPLGLGQPLGETGWRLSQGERARLLLVRGLMADTSRVIVADPIGALDAATAMQVLDALADDPRVEFPPRA